MARRSARERGTTLSAPASTWAWLLVLAATQFWLGVLALAPDGRMSCQAMVRRRRPRTVTASDVMLTRSIPSFHARAVLAQPRHRHSQPNHAPIRPSGASANTPSQNWVAAR